MINWKDMETVKYKDLQKGDVIAWYGALLRIVAITRMTRTYKGEKDPCVYFTVEPFSDESIKILGRFYARGTYGGVEWLEVARVKGGENNETM